MSERIGLLGGTFDPVHVAHLALAVAARHQLGLHRVILMVANVPWQKAQTRRVSAPEDRLAMVRCAVAGREGLEAGDLEILRGGDSYTSDTLFELLDGRNDREVFLIIGSDLVAELPTWNRWEELPALCTLAVAYRPGESGPAEVTPGWASVGIRLPALELSSSELREMAAQGRPLDFLVPDAVMAEVARRGLYR